jgi:succinyl-CoA synthetase beta subunit
MNIHEYQAKEIFTRYGIPVPRGKAVFSADEAAAAATELIRETSSETVVVKAQIHAGGRGKAGGVKVVRGAQAARETAEKLLGTRLVTKQTGPEGHVVRRLLVEQGLDIARELYVAVVIDRAVGRVCVMASAEGGVDIEEVAAHSPEKIMRQYIEPGFHLHPYQGRQLAYGLGLRAESAKQAVGLFQNLVRAFEDIDGSLVECNPLVVLKDGRVVALDGKINLDDNAHFRHSERDTLRDLNEEDPAEIEAKKYDLSYIKLDGTIGCMVNGAGLAMATMDIIKTAGGEPANFLDVGGGATKEKVTAAFKILTSDPHVRAIFINIFGGIMKCDTIAEGVLAAVKEIGLRVPLVVRLEGTNVERGRELIANSGLNVIVATDMADGARKAVAAAASQTSDSARRA